MKKRMVSLIGGLNMEGIVKQRGLKLQGPLRYTLINNIVDIIPFA